VTKKNDGKVESHDTEHLRKDGRQTKGISADQERLKEEMTSSQELLKEEMLPKLDACHKKMMARMLSQLEKMETCLEKTEAMDLEANLEE
jgi:hypothetical protein